MTENMGVSRVLPVSRIGVSEKYFLNRPIRETRESRKTPPMKTTKMKNGSQKDSVRAKAIEALKCNNGRLPIYKMLKWGVSYSAIDDMLESANCPFRLEFEPNGQATRPKTWVVLKDYAPPRTVSQEEAARRLNSMSNAEFYALIDPTYAIRRSSHGRHRRTSTSADEYLAAKRRSDRFAGILENPPTGHFYRTEKNS
jgi:hypothetical protein